MEWITVTAPTVAEAKEQLLDKLGVPDGEAEFIIEDEGESKFFGLRRTQARVRARVQPRRTEDRRDRKRTRSDRKRRKPETGTQAVGAGQASTSASDSPPSQQKTQKKKRPSKQRAASTSGGDDAKQSPAPERPAAKKVEVPMEQVTARLQAFLDGLTESFGVDTSTTITETDGDLTARIAGQHGVLVGPKARTLDAIQELAKIAAFKGGTSGARIRVDVGEYRERRAAALVSFAEQAAAKAVADDTEVVLEPMSASDRKTVHDALAGRDDIQTRSVGTDPRRRVVIGPASSS